MRNYLFVLFASIVMFAGLATAGPNLRIVGAEGLDAVVQIYADDGDDLEDQWTIESEGTGNDLTINNGVVEVMNISSQGVVTLMSGGTLPADNLSGTAANGTVAPASLNSALQDMAVGSISAAITPNANGGTNVVVCTLKDLGGNTLTGHNAFRFFISDTTNAAPAAVAGDVAITGGFEIKEVTDKAVYDLLTSINGTVTITITDDPGRTNRINFVNGGGIVTASNMVWNIP